MRPVGVLAVFLAGIGAGAIGCTALWPEPIRPAPVYVGGPGGGKVSGGRVIVNVPQGTAVMTLRVGCPGSAGERGGNAVQFREIVP